jgi:hypothetical protein
VANAAFVAVFFAGSSAGRVSSSPAMVSSLPSMSATTATRGDKTSTTLDLETWAQLQTGDLSAFLARLRAEGFPPAMVRALMAEQIRAQFAPRRAALNASGSERPFWEPTTPQDPQTAAALRDLTKEQNQALKDLMGPDPAADESYAANLRRQVPGLSDDKISQLEHIQQDFGEKRSDLLANVNGSILPDDREKLTALEKAQHAAIASALTPEELEDYDLRTSNTANSLRSQLSAFDTTEQEFRTLFAIRQAYDDRLGPMTGLPTQDEIRARSDAQKQQNEEIKTALGDDRYADYQRANDGNYRQTSQLVTRLDLPPETTNQIYAMQQDIQQRARAVQTQPHACAG